MTNEVIVKFVLNNWKQILFGVLLLALMAKFRYDYHQLEKAYETSQQSLEEQIAGLKDIHKRELERRDEAIEKYRDALEQLEESYLDSQVELERERNKYKKDRVKDFKTDPDALSKDIEEAFGFINAR
jgi:uncharacterized membrane protein YccC|tara:strand:- start:632 stop:1015 length:384 start_codon:yes stop_codon:yes gene_type:complete